MNPLLHKLNEFAFIDNVTRGFPRSPLQANRTHETDAELIRQVDGSHLAVTIDTLLEEYKLGLVHSPFTVGWSVITQSLSDLAAVGADPIGVLNALILPPTSSQAWFDELFGGMRAALESHSTFCLGGDTGFDESAVFSSVAIGRIPADRRPLTRLGAKPGDFLYITGPLGTGNMLAIARQADKALWEKLEREYRPKARLTEAISLSKWVHCAIDTSDALMQALAVLSALNEVGIRFEHRPELYGKDLHAFADAVNFPLWLINSFGLGEYELVLAVGAEDREGFLAAAGEAGIPVTKIGEVTPTPAFILVTEGREIDIDAPYLLNLLGNSGGIDVYLRRLLEYHARIMAA
jgi:thiamine-monophosphate kinase